MIKKRDITGFVLINKEGQVAGFGFIRPCIDGHRIGPLYADNIEGAQELFFQLLNTVANSTVFIDLPATNPYGAEFTDYFNLERVSEADTIAMFKNGVPQSLLENSHKNYAIFSLEVG